MFKTRVIGNFQMDAVDVFVLPHNHSENTLDEIMRPDPDTGILRVEKVGEHDWAGRCRPTYRIPSDVAAEIVRQQMRELLPEGATVDALKDARAVRDRLLTLIEGGKGA